MRLVDCALSLTKVNVLFQAYLPKLKVLSFDNARHGNGIDWVRGCFALTVHSWPQLASNFLTSDQHDHLYDNVTYSAEQVKKLLVGHWLEVRASAEIMQMYPKVWLKSLVSTFELDIAVLLAIGLHLQEECVHGL